MSEYLLAPNIHICLVQGSAIFLDLTKQAYLGIGGKHASQLQRIIRGLDSANPSVSSPPSEAIDVHFVNQLLQQGLITSDSNVGHAVERASTALPSHLLYDRDRDAPASIFLRDVIRIANAYMATRLELKLRPLSKILDEVKRRKVLAHQKARVNRSLTELQRLTSAFLWLRLFLYGPTERCLLDSLTLLRFLAPSGFFPELVLGAKAIPFGAHAWVQHGDALLNCPVEFAHGYQPILAV